MGEVAALEVDRISLPRLLSMQSAIGAILSLVVGVVTTVQFSFGLVKFGGLEYAPRVLILSAVHDYGPGVSAAASLYALLVWTHEFQPNAIRPCLVRAAPWTLGLVALTAPLAVLLAVVSGNLVSNWAYGVPWDLIGASHRIVTLGDVADGGLGLIGNLFVSGVFCWFALPIMSRRSWALLHKLGVTWAAFALLGSVSHLLTA
jgi:hypothetical protein